MLFLWSINGDLIASVNTLQNSNASPNQSLTIQIFCAAFSTYTEWDNQNVIMTGSSDGVVRMWSLDYIQVPIQDVEHISGSSTATTTPSESGSKFTDPSLAVPSKDDIVRRLSVASQAASNKDEEDQSTEDTNSDDGIFFCLNNFIF